MKEKDILLALVAAHEQLLWAKDLLRWKGATANKGVEEGTEEALEALEGTLGTAILDVAVEEAKEVEDFDLCDELRKYMSCDHCLFNSRDGKCWISDVEQNEEGWKDARERWMEAKNNA